MATIYLPSTYENLKDLLGLVFGEPIDLSLVALWTLVKDIGEPEWLSNH